MNRMFSRRYTEPLQADVSAPLVAVAIDKDKGSQNALKWAVDNLMSRGQTLTLVHVKVTDHPATFIDDDGAYKEPTNQQIKDLFLPFRCFCTRKDIQCKNVLVEDTDVAKGVIEFVTHAAVEKLVVGAPSKMGFVRRFKQHNNATNITEGVPDFCTVYVISKGKVSAMRDALLSAPANSPLRAQIQNQASLKPDPVTPRRLMMINSARGHNGVPFDARSNHSQQHDDSVRSPFSRGLRCANSNKSYTEQLMLSDSSDISFVSSSGRPSFEHSLPPRLSYGSENLEHSFEMARTPLRSLDSYSTANTFSSISQGSAATGASWSSQAMEEVEEEMKRLRLELKHTTEMYNNACKEALTAKQKAVELQRWKIEEEKKLNEAHMAEEAAMALVEKERVKYRVAMEAARADNRLAEREAQKLVDAEKRALTSLSRDLRYRKYTIEEIEAATEHFAAHLKIGEGGYGPVFKCYLDHTAAAVKVLRPDAAQGRSQFHQEVQVLSCIRHPNMVLLLGACPEYGCLVYEYMAQGSLEDRLFRRGNTLPIPWSHRFRIAAEIATGLLFLHLMKPEPLVHRDLKPANILLDRNFVAKISDVGLARLVPPSVADTVTQYRMTSTAGTFCYIDPEYQQTGMLGVKSDIYSFGVLLLQLLTARPPMGLTHHVSRAIESGTLADILDPAVPDWPLADTKRLAEIALRCTELRRKDRPDLENVVLPELQRLSGMEEDGGFYFPMNMGNSRTSNSQVSSLQDMMSDRSGYSSMAHSSESTATMKYIE